MTAKLRDTLFGLCICEMQEAEEHGNWERAGALKEVAEALKDEPVTPDMLVEFKAIQDAQPGEPVKTNQPKLKI